MEVASDSSKPRQFSLGLYLLIVVALSWPILIASAIWATDLTSALLMNGSAMMMVTVATYIAGRYVFRDGFANAGWHWGTLKDYLIVLGIILLMWGAPTLVRVLTGDLGPESIDSSKLYLLFLLPLVTLLPGFGEEFGWRGYMLPHMARSMPVRKAVFWHAVIWWAWHLPVLVGTGIKTGIATAEQTGLPVVASAIVTTLTIVLVGMIPTILHGVIFAYLWARTPSLAVATVYHALYDGVRDALGNIANLSTSALWANAVVMVLGILFLWKGNWKNLAALREQATPAQPEIGLASVPSQ